MNNIPRDFSGALTGPGSRLALGRAVGSWLAARHPAAHAGQSGLPPVAAWALRRLTRAAATPRGFAVVVEEPGPARRFFAPAAAGRGGGGAGEARLLAPPMVSAALGHRAGEFAHVDGAFFRGGPAPGEGGRQPAAYWRGAGRLAASGKAAPSPAAAAGQTDPLPPAGLLRAAAYRQAAVLLARAWAR